MKHSATPVDAATYEAILAVPGITRFQLQPGQVLWYEGHVPAGWVLLLRGTLETCRGSAQRDVITVVEAGAEPLLIDGPRRDRRPATSTLRARTRAEVVMILRSQLLFDRTIQQALRTLAPARRRPPRAPRAAS